MTNTRAWLDTDLALAIRRVASEFGAQRFNTVAAVIAYRVAERTPTTLGALVVALLGGGSAANLDLRHLIQVWNAAVLEVAALSEDGPRPVHGLAREAV